MNRLLTLIALSTLAMTTQAAFASSETRSFQCQVDYELEQTNFSIPSIRSMGFSGYEHITKNYFGPFYSRVHSTTDCVDMAQSQTSLIGYRVAMKSKNDIFSGKIVAVHLSMNGGYASPSIRSILTYPLLGQSKAREKGSPTISNMAMLLELQTSSLQGKKHIMDPQLSFDNDHGIVKQFKDEGLLSQNN